MESSSAERKTRPRRERGRQQPTDPMTYATIAIVVFGMIAAVVYRLGRPATHGTCSFDPSSLKAVCKGKGLLTIPSDIPDTVRALQMGDPVDPGENRLTQLRRENLSRLKNLRELSLMRCDIESIQDGSFEDLSGLRSLDLRFNRIRTLSDSTFRGLGELDHLLLSNNPIQVLDDGVFRGLRIAHLEFANNPVLGKISTKAFQETTVSSLIFNRCNLKSVKQDIWSALAPSLRVLQISDNLQPLDIREEAFQGFRLERLLLSNNGITSTGFLKHGEFEDIELDRNPLESLKFWNADRKNQSQKVTKRLSLSGAKISKISKDSFSLLGDLETLNLSSNSIPVLNADVFGNLFNLTVLDLSNNDVVEFSGDFTKVLPNLKVLLLDGNELETLPNAMESFFSRLENLTLSGNPFHCNCEMKWFFRWLDTVTRLDRIRLSESLACRTPDARNFSQISREYDLHCRAPSILNATIDSDGMTLICTAEGDPAPAVTWLDPFGEESTTDPESKSRRDLRQTSGRMTMVKNGNYTCSARNVAGSDRMVVDTNAVPLGGGVKLFADTQQRISILETPRGFLVAAAMVALLGYILRQH